MGDDEVVNNSFPPSGDGPERKMIAPDVRAVGGFHGHFLKKGARPNYFNGLCHNGGFEVRAIILKNHFFEIGRSSGVKKLGVRTCG